MRKAQDSRHRAALKQRLKQFHTSDCEHRSCAGINIRSAARSSDPRPDCNELFSLQGLVPDTGKAACGDDGDNIINEKSRNDACAVGEEADADAHHSVDGGDDELDLRLSTRAVPK